MYKYFDGKKILMAQEKLIDSGLFIKERHRT